MGEEDSTSGSDYCNYKCTKRDCDGDLDNYCTYIGSCSYKRNIIDADGDTISMCGK